MIKKSLMILLLCVFLIGCKSEIEEPKQLPEEQTQEPAPVPTPEPAEEPIPDLAGTWEGEFTETQTAQPCTVENTGTITLTFDMDGDAFTGTFEERGTSRLIEGSTSCAGDYVIKGTTSGTIVGGDKVSATMVIKSEGLDVLVPWSATIVDDVMTGKSLGTGTEDGIEFTSEGTFSLTRTG